MVPLENEFKKVKEGTDCKEYVGRNKRQLTCDLAWVVWPLKEKFKCFNITHPLFYNERKQKIEIHLRGFHFPATFAGASIIFCGREIGSSSIFLLLKTEL